MKDKDLAHVGHRKRAKKKFLASLGKELHDYELLEILLFSSHARQDVKPIAKDLITKFGSLAKIINSDVANLKNIEGVGESAIVTIKIINEIINRSLKNELIARPILNNWQDLLAYCRSSLASLDYEVFKAFFLDKRYCLIADADFCDEDKDVVAINSALIIKKALNLSASFIILAHNHPTGDTKPSKSDILITNKISELAKGLKIKVLDHLIIGKDGHFSFKENSLL